MSYFVTVNRKCTIDGFVSKINKLSVGRWVFQFGPSDVYGFTTVIFKFDDYPGYVYFCEKTKRKPVSTEEFFPANKPESL